MAAPQTFFFWREIRGRRRILRVSLGVLAVVLLAVAYDLRLYRNIPAAEAMDAAQVARNLAGGRGYTTSFVRPLSMRLLLNREQQTQKTIAGSPDLHTVPMGHHPDLANPPVYPLLLAAAMKLLPFQFTIPRNFSGIWSISGQFARYQPDFLIALCNQLLFLALIVVLFFLARRLFDSRTAVVSAVLLLGTELLWRFSVSGLSTMLLLLIFAALVWVLVLLEKETRAPRWGRGGLACLAALAGLVVGVGALTRYSFGCLIIPVLVFVITISGPRRMLAGLLALVAFAVVLGPWVIRNYSLSGEPFGVATYAVLETTYPYPEFRLQRTLQPETAVPVVKGLAAKFIGNLRGIVSTDLPKLGGSWVSALFLAGLLVPLPQFRARRLRYFLLGSLTVLVVVQALGKTQLSEDSPEINSENLLVLVAPVVVIYGVSLFFTLLKSLHGATDQLRQSATVAFGMVACLPLLLAFLPPRVRPLVYPPYNPPMLQFASNWAEKGECTMSDIPWAMAWYGQSQCVWLTLDSDKQYFEVDAQKPIQVLLLSPKTMNEAYASQWANPRTNSWEEFVLSCKARREKGSAGPPLSFPLQFWHWKLPQDHFLLTARLHPVRQR